nr:MAG TPA: hypothetical protein [Caudoviricetes sp.]
MLLILLARRFWRGISRVFSWLGSFVDLWHVSGC